LEGMGRAQDDLGGVEIVGVLLEGEQPFAELLKVLLGLLGELRDEQAAVELHCCWGGQRKSLGPRCARGLRALSRPSANPVDSPPTRRPPKPPAAAVGWEAVPQERPL